MNGEEQEQMNARDIALWALREKHGNVAVNVDRLATEHNVAGEDRSLARELAIGVMRHRGLLRAVVRSLLAKPGRRLPGPVGDIISLGMYQILFLDRVPDFAAVDEAVNQVIRTNHRRQSGLVNGVLRTAARQYEKTAAGEPSLAAEVIPIGPNAYYVAEKPIFADPGRDPAAYLAEAFSLPEPLGRRWIARFGGLENVAKLAMHANSRAPMIVRVNTLKTGVDALMARLVQEGVETRRHSNGVSVVVYDAAGLLASKSFAEGLMQPQDAVATAVCLAAAPKPGVRVLDLCAAPGTKTTHMAELMNDTGEIVAADVPHKLRPIEENCERMGISIVRTIPAEKLGSLESHGFDLVLADVPCSNTGVLARRVEARCRFDQRCLTELVKDQRFLAEAGAGFVKPGGRLVYSTCSLEAEECSEIAEYLVRRNPHLEVVYEKLTMPRGAVDPTQWNDGGYVAIFQA